MTPYRVVLELPVVALLAERRRRNQLAALKAFEALGENPFQSADFVRAASNERTLHGFVFGDLTVICHIDHAEREVRIVDVIEKRA